VAAALAAVVRSERPSILLAGATDRGRALLPRLAALLGTGLTADCTALALDPATGDLLQTRPAFGGNILATIRTARHRPQLATVRPALFPAPAPRPALPPPALRVLTAAASDDPVHLLARRCLPAAAGGIAQARVLVAGGRGLGSAAGFDLLRELARRLGGAVAASRAAVEAGWADEAMQVGQTGRSVHPDLYVAVGISGAVQHLAGIAGAHRVVAINRDEQAPILQRADHVLLGDWRECVTAWRDLLPEVPA
jgi:electron transfer flavoprotein alpha subunit